MCLLIAQPRGVTFSKADLRDYLSYNGDGFGMCVPVAGTLEIVRIVDDPKAAIAAYYALAAGKKAMLHFRMATHGTKGVENCHPFLLTPDIACAHNGILEIEADSDTGASDTRLFCDNILAPIARDNPDALFTADMRALLGSMIGESNRLMFMRADGKVSIVNEASGVVHRKAWLSNTYAWSAPGNKRRWLSDDEADYGEWWKGELQTGRNVQHTASVTARLVGTITPDAAQDNLLAHRAMASAEDGEDVVAFDMIVEGVADAWFGYGGKGVAEWLQQNTEDAASLLSAWYEKTTPEQALALVTGNPERAAEWLIEIASEQD